MGVLWLAKYQGINSDTYTKTNTKFSVAILFKTIVNTTNIRTIHEH